VLLASTWVWQLHFVYEDVHASSNASNSGGALMLRNVISINSW
jgi:hypothetical protein